MAFDERERERDTQMLTTSITAFSETPATKNENLLIRIAAKINDDRSVKEWYLSLIL